MDIFPNLLGDAEFRNFTQQDYAVLSGVLNDTLAKYLSDYIKNPEADPKVVQDIKDNLNDYIESLTFHFILRENGTLDLIGKISPETILSSGADLNDIYTKLKYLEDNISKLRTFIPPRTKTNYTDFVQMISRVVGTMIANNQQPTYPDIMQRIGSNKFVFYIPGDSGHNTGTGIVNSRRRQWTMCLRGLEYKKYCDDNGINLFRRRVF
jgi:hypothetical protein